MPTLLFVVSTFKIEVPAAFCSWIAEVELAQGKRARVLEPTILGLVSWVIKTGLVENTNEPLPVSSEIAETMPLERLVADIALAPLPITRPVKVLAPVPPLATANCPVQPRVKLAALSKAVVDEAPKVRVTLVSSVLVKAAPVISEPASVALIKLVPSPRRTLPEVAALATLKPVFAFTTPEVTVVWPAEMPVVKYPPPTT